MLAIHFGHSKWQLRRNSQWANSFGCPIKPIPSQSVPSVASKAKAVSGKRGAEYHIPSVRQSIKLSSIGSTRRWGESEPTNVPAIPDRSINCGAYEKFQHVPTQISRSEAAAPHNNIIKQRVLGQDGWIGIGIGIGIYITINQRGQLEGKVNGGQEI